MKPNLTDEETMKDKQLTDAESEIKEALARFEVSSVNLEIIPVAYHRFKIIVDGVEFGIYDTGRHTFVD